MSGHEFSLFYVEEIERNCRMIAERIAGFSITHDSYASSPLYQDMLTMPLLRACEIVKTYRRELEGLNPGYDWKPVAGMRDKMAHPYGGFDYEFVWDVAENDLDSLLEACEDILGSRTR